MSAGQEDSVKVEMLLEPGAIKGAKETEQLANAIYDQISTAFNYFPSAPFKVKSKLSNSDKGLRLTNIKIIPGRMVVKDLKNGLTVKSGPASGSLSVDYILEQSTYSMTLVFEDSEFNIYSFPMSFLVNHNTQLFVVGMLSIDILKVLPASVQHVLAALFDEVFTAQGSSENKLIWKDNISHTMLPLVSGEMTVFQNDLISSVIIPLCHRYSDESKSPMDCTIPDLNISNIKDAVALKMQAAGFDQTAINGYRDATMASSASTSMAYTSSKNRAANEVFYLSRCEITNEEVGMFRKHKLYNFYFPVVDSALPAPLSYSSRMYVHYRSKDGWVALDSLAYNTAHFSEVVQNSECSSAGELQACVKLAVQVKNELLFDNICKALDSHGALLEAGVGVTFNNLRNIEDPNYNEFYVNLQTN